MWLCGEHEHTKGEKRNRAKGRKKRKREKRCRVRVSTIYVNYFIYLFLSRLVKSIIERCIGGNGSLFISNIRLRGGPFFETTSLFP